MRYINLCTRNAADTIDSASLVENIPLTVGSHMKTTSGLQQAIFVCYAQCLATVLCV